MTQASIKLKNISLDYFQYVKRYTLKKKMLSTLMHLFRKREGEIIKLNRALEGINAEFKKGDRIAILGKNGSGKSTLLRVISGIYRPTNGLLEVKGTITSLLDIGVGLNTDATGYENVILIGALHGNTKREMQAKFQEIEEFTELKDYLKMPVRTYSTGMRLRLAFSIITSIESDILIFDEVIGVGDQSFMEKAHKRLENLVNKCQILILTSHSRHILPMFCNKSLVLSQGKCAYFGDLQSGLEFYEKK